MGDDKKFKKGWGSQTKENEISRGESSFLFYQSTLLSHFVPVSLDTTLKERFLKLMTVLF